MGKKVLIGLGALVVALVLVAVTAAYAYWPAEARAYRSVWRQTVDSRFVDTPQARIHYVRAGAGSPVILLAPSPGWAVLWQRQLGALGRSHTVYAVDLPGNTGYTRLKGAFRYDLDGITGALDDFVRALRLGRLTLVGNSWGGGFALAYAQRHPERVSRLVLISASGLDLPDPSSWELMKWPVVGELAAKLSTSRSTLRSYAAKSFADPRVLTDELLEEIYAPMTFRENVRAVYRGERALDWKVTDRALERTRTPTLVVWGQQDKVYAPARAQAFGRRLPNATVTVLDRCGHTPMLDCADRLNPLLSSFLRGAA